MVSPMFPIAALAGCLAVCACAATPLQTTDRENLLVAAGFTAVPANTPARLANLRSLPANRVIRRRAADGSVRYAFADPLICGCVYIGDQAAYARYNQEVTQRRLADARNMTPSEQDPAGSPWEMGAFEGVQ